MRPRAGREAEARVAPLDARHLARWIRLRNRAFGGRTAEDDAAVRANLAARLPWTRGTFVAGEPVATGTWFPFRAYVGGVPVVTGALGGVASAPEHRRQGHVRALLWHGLHELHSQGVGLALEHPFDPRFYGALGFASVAAGVRLHAPLDRVAGDPKRAAFEEVGAGADDEMLAVRDVFAQGHTFAFLRDWRPDGEAPPHARQWTGLFDPPTEGATRPLAYRTTDGYAIVATDGFGSEGTLHVVDAAWRDAAGRRRVLDLLGAWRGQVDRILIDLPAADPLARDEAPRHTAPRAILQARIVDVAAALRPLRGPRDAAPRDDVIEVDDSFCDWNAGRWRVRVGPEGCEATPTEAEAAARVDVRGLAAVLAGVPPAALQAAGLADGDPAALAPLAGTVASHPPFLGGADYF
ncbi:MAG: GNAT family N-acetyltransferase [Trueperaceae bacterium]|nr:GNAT family N-acetyltransferase [Trueperaceae bacterium]